MPNRIIKESLLESDKVSSLNDFQFRVWIGLILNADDRGHGDARSAIIKAHVFPLRERVTLKDIDDTMQTLAAAGCISLYEVGGKSYYEFPNWSKHQQVKNVRPKYPLPEEGQYIVSQNSAETRRNSQKSAEKNISPQKTAETRGEILPEYNTIQSNTNTNQNTNKNPNPNQGSTRARANHQEKFTKPTLDEVKAYCQSRGNKISAERFYAYYESNGWSVGRGKMKDWKAAVRYWETDEQKAKSFSRPGSFFFPTGNSDEYAAVNGENMLPNTALPDTDVTEEDLIALGIGSALRGDEDV